MMNEPRPLKDLQTNTGGAKEEQRSQDEWKIYKAWYNAQSGNRVML